MFQESSFIIIIIIIIFNLFYFFTGLHGDIVGGTVSLQQSPPDLVSHPVVFLLRVCMLSMCMWGIPPGTLTSSPSPKP